MTLPKSHKKDTGEHDQARTHAPIGSTYGKEENQNPNRRGWEAMDKSEAQKRHIAGMELEANRRGETYNPRPSRGDAWSKWPHVGE